MLFTGLGYLGFCASFFLVVCIARCLFTILRRHKLARVWECQRPRSKLPVVDPILGLDFIYGYIVGKHSANYVESSRDTFEKLGSTYVVSRWIASTIYTCDSDNIKRLLSTGFKDFKLPDARVGGLSSVFGNGIFSMTDHQWFDSRKILRSGLNGGPDLLEGVLERYFQVFLQHLPADGSTVAMQPLFFLLTMDVATWLLFGVPGKFLCGADSLVRGRQFMNDYMECSEVAVRRMQAGPLQGFVCEKTDIRGARQRVFAFIDSLIDESSSLTEGKNGENRVSTVFGHLANTREGLREQALHLLLASRDTTASVLSNLFFMLAKSPEAYQTVRQEVMHVTGGAASTAAQLKEMQYLKWCIQECLRLYPPIPINARQAVQDTSLPRGGGDDGLSPLFVGKGTVIMYNIYSMHRDPEIFGPDPKGFRPERWKDCRPGWSYLPFNGGPRVCIGQQLALTEVTYIASRICQHFSRMESRDDREWLEMYALAMTCENQVEVGLYGEKVI